MQKKLNFTNKEEQFFIQNRRYLGNKYKLLDFLNEIINKKCLKFNSFCDIFAGTGVVGDRFNKNSVKIISNDILLSNYFPLKAFLGTTNADFGSIEKKISFLNSLKCNKENYFSSNFGGTYFTIENSKKIGTIREQIESTASNESEKAILITSLLYAADKVANTVGHYDAYRKKLDSTKPLKLLVPTILQNLNNNNEIYQEDANKLIRKISTDVLYVDPPYNSRQYSDLYHLLENLASWSKPPVEGIAKKMNRDHIKSEYSLKSANIVFMDLISNAKCKHILVSYNNTGKSKDGRSNAKINDNQIINTLNSRGDVEIFERSYKAFSAGKSNLHAHTERVFYCKVKK